MKENLMTPLEAKLHDVSQGKLMPFGGKYGHYVTEQEHDSPFQDTAILCRPVPGGLFCADDSEVRIMK